MATTRSRDLNLSNAKLASSEAQFLSNPQTPHSLQFSTHSTPYHPKTLALPIQISFKSKPSFSIRRYCHSPTNSPDHHVVLDSSNKQHFPPALRNAASIGAATVASKILGLIREMTLASVFGVGPVVAAFKHASVLPGFCMSLLGGVNGPIHLTMATTLSKLSEGRRRKLIRNTNSLMFLIGGVVGGLVYVFAESIVYASAPGLWVLAEGSVTREIAVTQLKLMIPCVILSGPVGLGFGCLSAAGKDFFACISPALSSICIVISCIVYVSMRVSTDGVMFGGILIACGASLGSFSQWLMQVIVNKHSQKDDPTLVSWLEILKDRDVLEFFTLMLPAILTSGLAQIASFTDLYFASYIPFAAAGLSYAHLMAMAPLGLLSSVIILPLLPGFSESVKLMSWSSLMQNTNQAVILSMVVVLPIVTTMCVLAEPVIRILFRWSVNDPTATALVTSLLRCYSVGSPFYIIRELLVMVFYALGDSRLPFMISVAAIVSNGFLDWLFVSMFSLGAQGLALATSLVNALSVFTLFHLLSKKLIARVDTEQMFRPLLQLVICCLVSGCITSILYKLLHSLFSGGSVIRLSILEELLSVSLAGSLGIFSFFLLAFICLPKLELQYLFKTLISRMLHEKT